LNSKDMNFGTWMRTSSACRSVGHGSTCMMGQADRKGRTVCTAPGHSGAAEWRGRQRSRRRVSVLGQLHNDAVALGRDGDDLHIRGRRWAAWGDSDRRRCAVEQRQGKRKREEERRGEEEGCELGRLQEKRPEENGEKCLVG
jgi:hypothetical protein